MKFDGPLRKLLTCTELERSGVVANCRMNRERSLIGPNGYSRDLRFNPLDHLLEKAKSHERVRWLDLCCGTGTALIEAATIIHDQGLEANVEIIGIDLVGMFRQTDLRLDCLRLIETSLTNWEPNSKFDVITCVHGLHYIGDKLGLIGRVATWLTITGIFAANLDLNNFRFGDGRPAGRIVAAALRKTGMAYNSRTKLLTCDGRRSTELPFRFLGADDQAGPNYTRQPAVDSYYDYIAGA